MSHYSSLYIKKDIKLHKIIYVLVHRNFLIYLVRQPYQRDMACWASWLSLWLIPWKIWLLWVHCIDAPRVSWEQEGCCGAWKTKWRGWSAPVCVLPVPPGHSPSSTFFMADLPFSMFLTAANSYICISSAPVGNCASCDPAHSSWLPYIVCLDHPRLFSFDLVLTALVDLLPK